MKIVVSEFSSGFADSTSPLCNELIKKKEIEELIYLSDKNNDYFKYSEKGVKTIELFDGFKTGKMYKRGSAIWFINRVFTSVKNAIKRNHFIKKERPDAVLIMATLSSIDRFFIGFLKRYTKIVMTVHDVIVPYESKSWNMSALKKTYDMADALVVHTLENKEQLKKLFYIDEEKIHVIHHGIENKYHKVSREIAARKVGISAEKPTLLFYGGIRESKGLDVLLRALNGISCQLVIAGAVPYGYSFEKYQKLIDENGIDCKCYIEFTSDEFRDYLFQSCDFNVLPYKEFFSQSGVFMQAIHYRKPVIATNVSSFKGFVEKYHMGLICEPNNVESMRTCINKALSDLSKGVDYTSALEAASEENSWSRSADLYMSLFKNIVES